MGKGVVLVNGAGGFLGSWVVERLCAEGRQVRATDLPGTNLEPARRAAAEVIEADLLGPEVFPRLFSGVSEVVNVAGLFNYSLPLSVLRQANVEVTRNMCAAAGKAGVSRFVHISSIAVYGRPQFVPMREDHPQNAANNYERSKKEAEEVVMTWGREKGLPAVILRPAGIYGPRSRYGQAAFMALLALYRDQVGKKIPVLSGGPRMHHVHVEDVAAAVLAVLKAAPEKVLGRAFNVADDTPLTQGELFLALMPELDLAPAFHFPYYTKLYWPFLRLLLALPASAFQRLNHFFQKKWEQVVTKHRLLPQLTPRLDRDFLGYMNADYVLDTSALKALGYSLQYPQTRPGLAQTVRWFQEQKWLPRFS